MRTTETTDDRPRNPYGYCPTCGAEAVLRCRCWQRHTHCANGHHWKFDRQGRIVLIYAPARPHHADRPT